MAKYMMVYKGEASDMSDMTEEQGAAVMAAWGGAQALADNHPFLSDDKGDFAVDIYELMPVPIMD